MKLLSLFSRLATQVLIGGAFLAIFLACPSSQAEAGSPSTDMQTPDTVSGKQLVAAENPSQQGEPTPPSTEPCPEGPGTCNSTNLNLPPGCTTGSKCSIENKICDPGKKCKTRIVNGVCYCGCVIP